MTESNPSSTMPFGSNYKTFRSIPKPQFPICISNKGPQPFSVDSRDRLMRQHYTMFWGTNLIWRERPSIELIKATIGPTMTQLGVNRDTLMVAFLDEGGYNTIYSINGIRQGKSDVMEFILRIPLPIDPFYKLECDVATTELMRHFTTIPVPVFYAYDSSTANPLGLEWMLMERIKGKEIGERWLDMDTNDLARISCQVAQWLDEMSRLKSNQIGGVYLRWKNLELEFFIGPSIHPRFSDNRRRSYSINRGPFDSFWDYYDAILEAQKQELEDPAYVTDLSYQEAPEIDEDLEYDKMTREEQRIQDLKNLQEYGPPSDRSTDTAPSLQALIDLITIIREIHDPTDLNTAIMHWDISFSNLFVDEHNKPIALLDWEYVDFEPLLLWNPWPEFLRSRDVEEDPEKDSMTADRETDPNTWSYLMDRKVELKQTRLRPIYRKRVEELGCYWLDLFELQEFGSEETWESELHSRVMDVRRYDYDIVSWVDFALEDTPKDLTDASGLCKTTKGWRLVPERMLLVSSCPRKHD